MELGKIFKKLIPMALSYMGSGGSLITSSIAQLATFAILARSLGTEQFALYVTITAFTNVAVQICGFGVQECIVRRVARDPADQPRMMGHALILTTGSFLVLFIIGLIRLIAALLGCLVFHVDSVAAWSMWYFTAHAIVGLAAVPLIWRLGAPKYTIVREELKIGALFSTQFIFKAIRQNTDLLVLGMFTSAEIVGSYGVARRVLDSSYLSVEALNRLIYPGSAVALMNGFHSAYGRVLKVSMAAIVISACAAIAVYILSPLMPVLFGADYPSMVEFTRTLCWVVVPMAIGSVALEAFGAAGRQDIRAVIYNSANIGAAVLVAGAIFLLGIDGAFASSYAVEILTAIAAWMVLMRFVQADRIRGLTPVAAE